MKNLFILLIICFTGCKVDDEIKPANPLANTNWRGPLAMGPNLYEFTNDSLFEYSSETDLLYYSGYTIKGNTLNVKGAYKQDWGKKTPYDTSYSVQFLIRNDSLFFNNIYKGKKY